MSISMPVLTPVRNSQASPTLDCGWNVVLHNDPLYPAIDVVSSLKRNVHLSDQKAYQVMLDAHNNGKSIVITVHKELAEHYEYLLTRDGLTITIEAN
jgi:ATP-dependent Clp protease adapter protein ClpS